MILTGLEQLLRQPERLAGRRYALLAHGASVTAQLEPIHLALQAAGRPPAVLLAPEHGYYAVEQDMVPAASSSDPWTGLPILSLYGDSADTLRPSPAVFSGLDLLVIDLQDVGSRYYTYLATAVWAAEAAAEAGCAVWLLDRPNPLGGEVVEGNLRQPGFGSFVGAFEHPVRHGLTAGELLRLEARRTGWAEALEVWPMAGWQRSMAWADTGLPWVAPSPNMPAPGTALIYPGGCLVEATELSEGRGTTRPFHLLGAPHLHPPDLARALAARELPGVAFLPTYFRPQFQKHAGKVCGGVEVVVTDAASFQAYCTGVELLAVIRELDPEHFAWRRAPYEFVTDRPAIDLLAGSEECRRGIEGEADLAAWIASWPEDEATFRELRRQVLLYPEAS